MVAYFSSSTPMLSSTMGWLFEEENDSFPHQLYASQPPFEVERSTTPSPDSTMVIKKLNHNATERDRRKKINSLISSLRSLLPPDQTKKLSIPVTISRVLRYIPELQKEVQGLTKKKEELLRKISRQGDAFSKESQRKIPNHNSLFAVSTTRLNDTEALIHISSYETHKAPLSEILQCLENCGLFLLNASSTQTFGGRIFHNLHFQVEKTHGLDSEVLTEKLLSIYEKKQWNF